MIRPTEEEEIRAEEWPEDDIAREYEELAEREALGIPEDPPWLGADLGAAFAEAGEGLEIVADLEARPDWAIRLAERETIEDRVTRRLEGLELDALDALAHYDEAAESRAVPDDDIQRESEAIAP